MSKQTWKPGTFIYPIPAVMVSMRNDGKIKHNNNRMDWYTKYKPCNGLYICTTN